MATIKHNFFVNAPIKKVFEAISTVKGLKGWWTTGTTGDPHEDGRLRFEFDNGLFNIMHVTGVAKNKFVAWWCEESTFASGNEWIATRLTFKLSKDEDKNVLVEFEHKGWKKSSFFYGQCNHHWGQFMDSLKAYCETGRGNPHGVGKEE